MKYPSDLTGLKFNRLTVVSKNSFVDKKRHSHWDCLCDCGNTLIVRRDSLTTKNTQSCGCLARSHEMSSTPEYYIWHSMKQRCLNKNHHNYPIYGNRGITVCDRWSNSFEAFINDMGKRPSDKHSIDRKNNNGKYET